MYPQPFSHPMPSPAPTMTMKMMNATRLLPDGPYITCSTFWVALGLGWNRGAEQLGCHEVGRPSYITLSRAHIALGKAHAQASARRPNGRLPLPSTRAVVADHVRLPHQ